MLFRSSKSDYGFLIDNLPKTDDDVQRREQIMAENAQKMTDLFERRAFDIMNSGQTDDVVEIEHATEKVDSNIEFAKFAQELERDLSVDLIRKKMGFSTLDAEKAAKVSQNKAKIMPVEDVASKLLPPFAEEQRDAYDDLYKRTRVLRSEEHTSELQSPS